MPALEIAPVAEPTDADLVARSLKGDSSAFSLIVVRHQSLVCALAYSTVGNLAESEDLAQETFVTAWKQLGDLREPEKLRAWLCGIVRYLALNFRRREGRKPTHFAEDLESVRTLSAAEPTPATRAIQRDEEAILWREMEQIPEIYREPLILFYRQHKSIEHVAVALDLTEDAVKMRLSRGRKFLQEQVLALVEGTLERSNPGTAFTASVVAALPMASTTFSKSAVLAATAAKGAASVKGTGTLGLLGVFLGPALGISSGWLGGLLGLRLARSQLSAKTVLDAALYDPGDVSRPARLLELKIKQRKLVGISLLILVANVTVTVALGTTMANNEHADFLHFYFICAAAAGSVALQLFLLIWLMKMTGETFRLEKPLRWERFAREHARAAARLVGRRAALEAHMAAADPQWATSPRSQQWNALLAQHDLARATRLAQANAQAIARNLSAEKSKPRWTEIPGAAWAEFRTGLQALLAIHVESRAEERFAQSPTDTDKST
jgi:RNA polymerase sigma factor (sigma-70 family)